MDRPCLTSYKKLGKEPQQIFILRKKARHSLESLTSEKLAMKVGKNLPLDGSVIAIPMPSGANLSSNFLRQFGQRSRTALGSIKGLRSSLKSLKVSVALLSHFEWCASVRGRSMAQ